MRRILASSAVRRRNSTCSGQATGWRHAYASGSNKGSGPQSGTISVDRSGLYQQVEHSHQPCGSKEPETTLGRILKSLIRFRGGPITTAEYMSEALINPTAGYYMSRDVFGRAGDFITSPEISQLFGEVHPLQGPRDLPLPFRDSSVAVKASAHKQLGSGSPNALEASLDQRAQKQSKDGQHAKMIGAWCALQWHRIGRPDRFMMVELGPGRGTLMQDLLRGTSTLPGFASAAEVHLVEITTFRVPVLVHMYTWNTVSPQMKRPQIWQMLLILPPFWTDRLLCRCQGDQLPPRLRAFVKVSVSYWEALLEAECHSHPINRTVRRDGEVAWHCSLEEVPTDAPAFFIAHEFFDALPVHQFRRTERGWREKLVDIAPDESPLHFSLALAPGPTPASKLLLEPRLRMLPDGLREALQEIEISPQSITTAQALAHRVASQDGAALIIDYGQDNPFGSSLQAIRQHQFVPLLSRPGDADLSCRVDFSALRQGIEESGAAATAYGIIPQAQFLAGLGIQARLQELLKTASKEDQSNLVSGYVRLLDYRNPDGSSPFDSHSEPASTESIEEGASEVLEPASGTADGPIEADGSALSETGERDDEGMGMVYKVLAIVPNQYSTPIPFPGWQES